MSEYAHLHLTGEAICRLMRQHKRSIAQFARDNGITQARVRQVRAEGVTGFRASEWHFMITGEWMDGREGATAEGESREGSA